MTPTPTNALRNGASPARQPDLAVAIDELDAALDRMSVSLDRLDSLASRLYGPVPQEVQAPSSPPSVGAVSSLATRIDRVHRTGKALAEIVARLEPPA